MIFALDLQGSSLKKQHSVMLGPVDMELMRYEWIGICTHLVT